MDFKFPRVKLHESLSPFFNNYVYLMPGESAAIQGYHNTHLQLAMSRGLKFHSNNIHPPNVKCALLLSR